MNIYQYPSDLNDQKYGGHSVSITVIEYDRKASAGTGDTGNAPVPGNVPSVNGGSALFSFSYTERQGDAIRLHLPESISATNSVNWDREEFGMVGSFAKFLGEKSVFGTQMSWEDTVSRMGEVAKDFGSELKDHAFSKMAKHLGQAFAFTGLPVYDLYMKSNRQAMNPHTELIFRGITPRTFPFNYTFRPKNPQEARAVDAIIRTFKRNMSPNVSGGPDAAYGRFFEYPNEFDIEFLFQDEQNPFIMKIARSVLDSCQVTYGPQGGFNSFVDGFPTEIGLNLTFSESKVITRQMIDEGY